MRQLLVAMRNATIVPAILFASCSSRPILDRHWPDAYWRSGDYVLIAIDTDAQMSLCADVNDGTKKFLVNVVDATVFSVGANNHYVVTKQHPLVAKSQTTFGASDELFHSGSNDTSDLARTAERCDRPTNRRGI